MTLGERFSPVLSSAVEGADWAWAELYRDLAPVLLRFLTTQGAAEPEDLLGECFVHMVRGLDRFRGDEGAFRAWAFTIARSRLVDSWRASGRRPVSPTGEVDETVDRLQAVEGPDDGLLERESVRAVLAVLTPDQRAVVTLRVLDQFSIEETAQIMGKSPGAVKVLQNRAVKALRRALQDRPERTLAL